MNSTVFGDFHDFQCPAGPAGWPASAGLSRPPILGVNFGPGRRSFSFCLSKKKYSSAHNSKALRAEVRAYLGVAGFGVRWEALGIPLRVPGSLSGKTME